MIDKNQVAFQVGGGQQSTVNGIMEQLPLIIELHNALGDHIKNFGDYLNTLCQETINRYRISNKVHRPNPTDIPLYWQRNTNGRQYIATEAIEPIQQDEFPELT